MTTPPNPGSPSDDGATEATDRRHLDHACALATASASGDGGPFGALVVKDGAVVATGANRVTADRDPTAHAEVAALRAAARVLGTHDLTGCALYASCQPCPMCLAAAWWARVDRVVYAATAADAAAAGFDDVTLWAAMHATGPEPIPTLRLPTAAAHDPFAAWAANPGRVAY